VVPSGSFYVCSFVPQFGWWLPIVRQISPTPRRGFLGVASQLPPRFASLLSSCLRLVSQMWSPCCFPDVVSELVQGFCGCCLLVFHLFPRCGLRIVFRLSSTIWICLPDLVVQFSPFFFHLSPRCFQVVCRIWFPTSMFMFDLSCRLSTRSFGKVRPWWRTMNQHKHYMVFPWCYFSVMRLFSIFWFASAACHPRTIL